MSETIWKFSDALYNHKCEKCFEKIEWECHPDADGPSYTARCCGLWYYMRPHKVVVEVHPDEE